MAEGLYVPATAKWVSYRKSHMEKDIRLLVHGHDFLVLADEEG
jgi:hypothetical protein